MAFDRSTDGATAGARDAIVADPAPLVVERVESRAMLAYQIAWADLITRTLEANVFLEPAFALPLIQHVERSHRPDFLLVWEPSDTTGWGRLVGLMPLGRRRVLPTGRQILRGFANKQQAGFGAPLLDRDRPAAIFSTMLAWLRAHEPRADALLLDGVLVDGAFHANLMSQSGAAVHVLHTQKRAVLKRPDLRSAPTVSSIMSAKRRKEIGRQKRRLAEIGCRTYTSARSPTEIARATERFLVLEGKGWKGERGTALLADPCLATFTRSMTRLMAQDGKCRIDSIDIDGRPVAMGIILNIGARAYFWKTSFDETFASLSPGVQFAHELTQVQLAQTEIHITDSCAVPDHPMIDRIWHDRLTIAELMINLRPETPGRFAFACRMARLRRNALDMAKTLLKRYKRRRKSGPKRHPAEGDDGRGGQPEGGACARTSSVWINGFGLPVS